MDILGPQSSKRMFLHLGYCALGIVRESLSTYHVFVYDSIPPCTYTLGVMSFY